MLKKLARRGRTWRGGRIWIERLAAGHLAEDADEVTADGAAYASIVHLKDFLLGVEPGKVACAGTYEIQ